MDKSRFGKSSSGILVPVTNGLGQKDWAFVPSEMARKFDFPSDLVPLLVEARACLGELNGVGGTIDNPDLLLQPLQLRESLTSSSLEGTYVTPEQFFMFELSDPKRAESSKKQDWREVHNYRKALKDAVLMLGQIPICGRLIKHAHKTLMSGVRGERQSRGEYRNRQVQIGSNARFIPPPPNEIPKLMDDLEKYINSEDDGIDPLVKSYLVHYQIEAIHPFTDGNGRIGRTLLALMIYKTLNLSKPWLYMSAFYERHKSEYVEKLFNVSAGGNWRDWLEFCLRGTIAQAKDSIRRCNALRALRKDFHARVADQRLSNNRTHEIINSLFESSALTIPNIRTKFKVTYPTARADVDRLLRTGILAELEFHTKPKFFYSPEILRIAHEEGDFSGETGKGELMF